MRLSRFRFFRLDGGDQIVTAAGDRRGDRIVQPWRERQVFAAAARADRNSPDAVEPSASCPAVRDTVMRLPRYLHSGVRMDVMLSGAGWARVSVNETP